MSSPASLFFPAAWIKSAAQEPDDVDRWQQEYSDYVRYPRFYLDEQGVLKVDPHRTNIVNWTLQGGGPMKHPTNLFGRFSKRKYLKILDKGTGWDDRRRVISPYHGTEPDDFNQDQPMLAPEAPKKRAGTQTLEHTGSLASPFFPAALRL